MSGGTVLIVDADGRILSEESNPFVPSGVVVRVLASRDPLGRVFGWGAK